MRNLIWIFILTGSATFAQQFDYMADYKKIAAETLDPQSINNYESLKNEFISRGEDFTVSEVLSLMIGQTVSFNYAPYEDIELELSYQNALNIPSDTIYKYAHEYMKINPVSVSLNYGLWKTYEKDNDEVNAAIFLKRFKLLCETILSTGNASDKPRFIVSPSDAWALVELYQSNAISSKGTGRNKQLLRVEILHVATKEGIYTTEYYHIQHVMVDTREELLKQRASGLKKE